MISSISSKDFPGAAQVFSTLILFCVSVPVLSTQSAVMEPSVSIEESLRTSECFFASRHAPMDRNTVSTTGNSSGMVAMARVMPERMLWMMRSLGSRSKRLR